ncbi:MAG: 2-oxoacid:acceptor oxidoreductase family protein, partial [Deltaproteobacteria bacterium]|nr:2-oxoacid:acceptor oxidoreductase family protein [Deltaproteobacteria bacterium]
MDVNLIIGGAAGQGLNTLEALMLPVLHEAGFHLFAAKEIMSRIRGGVNIITLRVSSEEKNSYREKSDVIIPLAEGVLAWVENRLTPETVMIGYADILDQRESRWRNNPVVTLESPGSGVKPMPANMVVSGLIAGLLRIDFELLAAKSESLFGGKGDQRAAANHAALSSGYHQGEKINFLTVETRQNPETCSLMGGSQAIALGAVAGGCDFLSFYPMSPATGVAVYLAPKAGDFGMVVEQYEDEIAAVGAAIGA